MIHIYIRKKSWCCIRIQTSAYTSGQKWLSTHASLLRNLLVFASCLAASDVSLCDWLKKWKIGRTEYVWLPFPSSTSRIAVWLRAGASFPQYRWFKTHREQLLQTVSPAFKPFSLRYGDFLFFSSALLTCITTQPYLHDKIKPHKYVYNGTLAG